MLSQIACLGGPVDESEEINIPRNSLQRKDETSFVRLCREGGHKGTVKFEFETVAKTLRSPLYNANPI